MNSLRTRLNKIEANLSDFDSRFYSIAQLLKTQQEYVDRETPSSTCLEGLFKDLFHRLNELETSVVKLDSKVSSIEKLPPPREQYTNIRSFMHQISKDMSEKHDQMKRKIRVNSNDENGDYVIRKIQELEERLSKKKK